MSDKNLNLNKNLLEAGGGGEYIKYVRIKEGQAKCVRGEKGGGGLTLAILVRMYHVDDPLT